MGDVTFPMQQDVKIRIDQIKIFNFGAKQIEWEVSARPVTPGGRLGSAVHLEIQQTPVDAALITLAPPADTVVEIAPGISVPIGNVPGALVYAWLQWYGESLCETRKAAITRIVQGLPPEEPPVEEPPVEEPPVEEPPVEEPPVEEPPVEEPPAEELPSMP